MQPQQQEFYDLMQEWESICAAAAGEAGRQGFSPSRALVTTVLDKNGRMRRAALLYDRADGWFDTGGWDESEHMHGGLLHIMRRDESVVGYQTQCYTRQESGLYKPGHGFAPVRLR